MQTVNISEFRANLLKYLEGAQAGESISITSNGKTLATITAPIDQQAQAKAKLQALAKTASIKDVVAPINSEWDALK